MTVVDPAPERPTFVIHGSGVTVTSTGDVLVNAIHALHVQSQQGLHQSVSTQPEVDWAMLLEPSDASDCPSVITLKAVGLPDFCDHACNLLLIG
jgi:hypothetical protein